MRLSFSALLHSLLALAGAFTMTSAAPPATGGGTEPASSSTSGNRQTTAAYITSMDKLNDTHPLAAGDQVSFRVIEDEDPPKSLSVMASGEMEVPYVGRMMAAGKNCKTLAYQLKSALEKEYYSQATVILGLDALGVKDLTPKGKVYMTGFVHAPGAIDIPADETLTLSRAIPRAGGFAEFANKRKVRVTHKGKNGQTEVKYYDCVEIIERGKHDLDVVLEPEDVIFVSDRWFKFN